MDKTSVQANASDKNRTKRLLLFFSKLAVSSSLLIYLILKLDLSSLSKLNSDIVYYLISSTLVMLIALWIMSLRWKFVLLLIEIKSYSLKTLYSFYLIGSFFNIFIPGSIGGDAMRLYYVAKSYNFSKKTALLSIFIERIAGLFALSMILMISLLFNNTVREKLNFGYISIALFSFALLIALYLAKFFIDKKMPLSYLDIGIILLFSGLGQFGDILVTYLFIQYFNIELTILNLMSIMPLVYVATVIPISLGGVGVREGVMTAGMALYGINISDAVMISFLLYFTKIIVGAAGWVLYMRNAPIAKDGIEP